MRWLTRVTFALAFALLLAILPTGMGVVADTEQLARVRREHRELVEANGGLRAEIAALESEVQALRQVDNGIEPSAAARRELERVAREDLNVVRPGEVVFEVHKRLREERTP